MVGLLAVWSTTVLTASATNRVWQLEPVMVSARGYLQSLDRIPGGAVVVDYDTLAEKAVVSVSDLSVYMPGIQRNADGPWGADLNIRGLSRDAVVFLIDGARVETANDLAGRLGFIHPLEVERIEALKGPLSARYGSGALGGVVQVFTRRGRFSEAPFEESRLRLRVTDNPSALHSYASASWNAPGVYLYGGAGYREADDYTDGNGDTVRNSQYEDRHGKIGFGLKLDDRQTLSAQAQYVEGREIGIPGSGTAPLPSQADVTYPRVRRSLVSVDYTSRPGLGAWEQMSVQLFRQHIDRRVRVDAFPAAAPLLRITPGANHHTTGGRMDQQFRFGAHRMTVGLDVWQRELESFRTRTFKDGRRVEDTPLPDALFRSSGLYVEDQWHAGDGLTVTFGGRADWIYVENDATDQWDERSTDELSGNAHLGAVWELSDRWRLRGVAARGYRAASIEERYTYLELGGGQVKFGNPDLDPEDSTFTELGLQWKSRRAVAGGSVFYNRLDHLIAEDVVDETTRVNANIAEAKLYGAELEGRWFFDEDWQAYGSVAWTVGTDRETDDELPDLPPANGLLGLRYEKETGWWGSIETPFAFRQSHVPDDVDEAPGWIVCDARLGWTTAGRRFSPSVYVGADNLFDAAYRRYLSTSRGMVFNEPGRSFILGCDITF